MVNQLGHPVDDERIDEVIQHPGIDQDVFRAFQEPFEHRIIDHCAETVFDEQFARGMILVIQIRTACLIKRPVMLYHEIGKLDDIPHRRTEVAAMLLDKRFDLFQVL